MSHQGAPGLPLGPPRGGVGGAPAKPGAQPEAPDPPRPRRLCFSSRLCCNTQSARHSCFSLFKLKTFTRPPISNSTGSVIRFEVCAPGPERVTHNPCFVVVTEGWGRVTVGVSWPRRPVVEGNRRLTYCCGLLPGLGSGPGGLPRPPAACAQGDPTLCGEEDPPNPAPGCPGDPQGGQRPPPTRPCTASLQAQEPQVALMGREGPWS